MVSTDRGRTWQELEFEKIEDGEYPLRTEVHPYDCNLVFLSTNRRLLYSNDRGLSFRELDPDHALRVSRLRITRLAGYSSVLLASGSGGIVGFSLATRR